MDYFKGVLSALAAIIIVECVPGSWSVFRGISGTKATGLDAIGGELVGSLLSPFFWILVVLCFALFYLASRLRNRILRLVLFWIPTLTVAVFCIAFVALYSYLSVRLNHL